MHDDMTFEEAMAKSLELRHEAETAIHSDKGPAEKEAAVRAYIMFNPYVYLHVRHGGEAR
jgi:hypothetical protein